MKQLFLVCLLFVLYVPKMFASCYVYAPCMPFAEIKEQIAEQIIGQAYDTLEQSIDKSEEAYEEYKTSIEEQNKLLSKIITTRQQNSVSMQKITFLLEKITRIKDVNIDIQTQHALKSFYDNHILKINKGNPNEN
jgi:hypothetical protein